MKQRDIAWTQGKDYSWVVKTIENFKCRYLYYTFKDSRRKKALEWKLILDVIEQIIKDHRHQSITSREIKDLLEIKLEGI